MGAVTPSELGDSLLQEFDLGKPANWESTNGLVGLDPFLRSLLF